MKFVISLIIAYMLVSAVGVNVVDGFASATGNNAVDSPVLGPLMTALIVAGGSATVLQLWKTFNFLPEPDIAESGIKNKNFSRIKVVVDRQPMSPDQQNEPLEVFIDGDFVGAIEKRGNQFPAGNFLWSGYPVETKEHIYEVVYETGTARELRWRCRHGVAGQQVKSSVLHFRLNPTEVASSQNGDIVTLIAPTALKSGDVFKVGSIIAVASADAEAGTQVKVFTAGVHDVPKVSGVTLAVGDKLYWDDTNKNFTKAVAENTYAGVAFADAASADAKVSMRIG